MYKTTHVKDSKPCFNKNWLANDMSKLAPRVPRTRFLLIQRSGLHVWLVMWRSWVRAPSKVPVVSLSKKLYTYCLVLVGSRKGFNRDFTIELK